MVALNISVFPPLFYLILFQMYWWNQENMVISYVDSMLKLNSSLERIVIFASKELLCFSFPSVHEGFSFCLSTDRSTDNSTHVEREREVSWCVWDIRQGDLLCRIYWTLPWVPNYQCTQVSLDQKFVFWTEKEKKNVMKLSKSKRITYVVTFCSSTVELLVFNMCLICVFNV